MPKHILYTRKSDNGVSVCTPMPWLFARGCNGGGLWDDMPRGFLDELVRRKSCQTLQNGRHISEDAAWRFVKAMQFGGLTTSEVWEVVRLHDCTRGDDGTLHDLIDTADLPDRYFRDAWTRSANGGPIRIDVEKAKHIHWGRLINCVSWENDRRAKLLHELPPIDFNANTYRSAIKNARDEEEVRRTWPSSLPRF